MKRLSLILPGFLLLTACTVYVRPDGTPLPPPQAPVSEEAFYYTFTGQVLSETGAPMSNVSVTMEERDLFDGDRRDYQYLTARTNGSGYFYFQVKRNRTGTIRINDELLASESIRFRGPSDSTPYEMGSENFSVLPEEGTAYRHITNAGGNAFRITVPYSDMGFAFNEIKRLYENRDYREVVYKGRFFQETFGGSNSPYVANVRWMANESERHLREKMRAEFNALMALNDRRDFDSVISRGKDYIDRYRGIEGSRWEEARRLVGRAEYSRREEEYSRRETEYSRRADERDRREAEHDRRAAERSRHEREALERYDAMLSINEADYDVIISKGNAYIVEYGYPETDRSRRVERLVSEAETRKRHAEERKGEIERQKFAREQAARDQAARDQVAREQAAKDQAARDRAAKDKAAREQADKDKAAKDQSDNDQAKRERTGRDRVAVDQIAKDQSDKDQAAGDKPAKEQADKDKASKDKAAKDQADKDKAAKDKAAKEQADKDKAAKDKAAKDQADKDSAAKEQADRDKAAKDQSAKEQAAREQAARDQAARDQVARNQSSRGQAANDPPGRDRGAIKERVETPAAVAVAAAAPKAPAAPVNVAVAGGNIFRANCSACHGSDGNGTAMAPSFRGNGWIRNASKGEIMDTIRNGRQGPSKKYKKFAASMPNHRNMSDGDLSALADYIKSIN